MTISDGSESLSEWQRAKREWEKFKCEMINFSIPRLYKEELERVVKKLRETNPRMNRSRFIVEAVVKHIKEVKRTLKLGKE